MSDIKSDDSEAGEDEVTQDALATDDLDEVAGGNAKVIHTDTRRNA